MSNRLGKGRDLSGRQFPGQDGKRASCNGVTAQPGHQPSAPGRPHQHRRCQPPPRPRPAANATTASDRMNDFAVSLGVPVAWAGSTSPRPCGGASAAACPGSRSGRPEAPSARPGRARPARSRTSVAWDWPGAAPRPRAAARVSPRPWTRTTAPAARARTPRSPVAGRPARRTRALIMSVSKSQVNR